MTLRQRLREAVPSRQRAWVNRASFSVRIAGGKLSRWIRPRPTREGELRLHLGCRPVDHPAFVNVDGFPYPHVQFVRPLDDLSPFADGSASLVYACHCLEHFARAELPRILGEWRRVLRPGGALRLSVPDFDKLLDIYEQERRDFTAIEGVLFGGQGTPFDFHHVGFTRGSLTALLEAVGFRRVAPWTPGSSELTTFPDWSARTIEVNGNPYPISLNLEAER